MITRKNIPLFRIQWFDGGPVVSQEFQTCESAEAMARSLLGTRPGSRIVVCEKVEQVGIGGIGVTAWVPKKTIGNE